MKDESEHYNKISDILRYNYREVDEDAVNEIMKYIEEQLSIDGFGY